MIENDLMNTMMIDSYQLPWIFLIQAKSKVTNVK